MLKFFLDKFWYTTNFKFFYNFYNQLENVNYSSCFDKSAQVKYYCHVKCKSHSKFPPHVNNFLLFSFCVSCLLV